METSILTNLLNIFTSALDGGYIEIYNQVFSLVQILITIELALFCGAAMFGSLKFWEFLFDIIVIGFVMWVASNFASLVNMIVQSFVQVGLMMSGSSALPVEMRDPGGIMEIGFTATAPIVEYLNNISIWQSLSLDTVLMGLAIIGILVAFAIIAIQVFVVYLEFKLVSNLLILFIPFGVLMQTRFLFGNVISAVIAFGVRFAMLAAIIAIGVTAVQSVELPEDPTWKASFLMMAVSWTVASLAWFAPSAAAGLLASSPSFSATTAASSLLAGGAGAKTISEQSRGSAGSAKKVAALMAAATVVGASSIKSGMQQANRTSVDKGSNINPGA